MLAGRHRGGRRRLPLLAARSGGAASWPPAAPTLRDGRTRGVWAMPCCNLLTGDVFDSAEALRLNFVQRVVPAGQELIEALRIAPRPSPSKPPWPWWPHRLNALKAVEQGPLVAMAEFDAVQKGLANSEDAKEGVASFREKRAPVFKGALSAVTARRKTGPPAPHPIPHGPVMVSVTVVQSPSVCTSWSASHSPAFVQRPAPTGLVFHGPVQHRLHLGQHGGHIHRRAHARHGVPRCRCPRRRRWRRRSGSSRVWCGCESAMTRTHAAGPARPVCHGPAAGRWVADPRSRIATSARVFRRCRASASQAVSSRTSQAGCPAARGAGHQQRAAASRITKALHTI